MKEKRGGLRGGFRYLMAEKPIYLRGAIVLLAAAVVVEAITFCKAKVNEENQNQIETSLNDVTAQNVAILEKEIADKEALLEGVAQKIRQQDYLNKKEREESLCYYASVYGFKRITYIDSDGMAYTSDGYEQDLSFQENFKLGMEGISYISSALTDTMGEQESINLISVPVYEEDTEQVTGVVSATYRSADFRDLISVQSFGGEAGSIIVEQNGTLVANTWTEDSVNNIFLYSESEDGEKIAADLSKEMKAGNSGMVSYDVDGKYYLYYMPLSVLFDNEESYIFTVVPAAVLDEAVAPVMYYLNRMLLVMAVVSFLLIFYYLYNFRKSRRELLYLAYTDKVTLGDNYACMKAKMERNRGTAGYLVALDLKEFKLVNHICGMERGNETLRQVQGILDAKLRKGELAAHSHADHYFLFLMEESREALLKRLTEISRIIEELARSLSIPQLGTYYGIYERKEDEPAEISFSKVNQAVQEKKTNAEGNYSFYDEMDFQRSVWEKELEGNFDSALENKEFEVWYQPKYQAETGKIDGAEALVRWREKDGTLIPPYQFVPLFEKNGMIARLDEYMFRVVCRQQREWQDMGRKIVPISVNVSRTSLYYRDILERYQRILQEDSLAPEYVPLEITESAAVEDEEIRDRLEEFYQAGFRIHLDDFGSGYSSLATLNVMHFDTIKLDKSLVDHVEDESGGTLVQHIVELIKSLGMKITAEGAETKEQVETLRRMRCTDIQGYYFSKPLPLEEFKRKIAEFA